MLSVRATARNCARAVLIKRFLCGTLQPAKSPASTEDMQVCFQDDCPRTPVCRMFVHLPLWIHVSVAVCLRIRRR